MEKVDHKGLLEILGGETGCRKLAEDFYARVATDAELKPLFPGKSFRCATEEFAAFLIQFLGGDEDQTQYRWWLSLRESHARFRISESQRAAWLGHMRGTARSFTDDEATRRALEDFFEGTSAYDIGKGEAGPKHPELKERWGQQRALDQVIDDLINHRDSEASLCLDNSPLVRR